MRYAARYLVQHGMLWKVQQTMVKYDKVWLVFGASGLRWAPAMGPSDGPRRASRSTSLVILCCEPATVAKIHRLGLLQVITCVVFLLQNHPISADRSRLNGVPFPQDPFLSTVNFLLCVCNFLGNDVLVSFCILMLCIKCMQQLVSPIFILQMFLR